MKQQKQWSFVDRPNFEMMIGILMLTGAACPKCGFGTRKTSKNWRRCKRESCGERVQMVDATPERVTEGAKAINNAIKKCRRKAER